MKLIHFGLQRRVRGMYLTAAIALFSVLAGWSDAWAAPLNTFDHTVQRPTPIYFGWGDAVPVPADYTGDGRHDLAVYVESSGMWYIRTMGSKHVYEVQLGGPGWQACPADYDGDGKADPAVYGNGVWGAALSRWNYTVQALELGANGSTPVPADYDGDGKVDPAVYRESAGRWSAALSSQGYAVETLEFGASGFAPAPADYDGDGRADPAVYSRTLGLWEVALSSRGYALGTYSFNVPDATPVLGDFDGDGKTDLAIYHDASGLWLGCMSGSGYALSYQMLGGGGYLPVAGRFYHKQRHTFGVYNPSSGEWLVQYTPALVGGAEESPGGPFGSILGGLVEGVGGDVVCWGVGWILDYLTHQDSGQQQIIQQLNSMNAQMTTLLGMSAVIESQLNSLTQQLNIAETTLETYTQWQSAQGAIDNITTYYDQMGGDGMATFFSSTFTNQYTTNQQQQMISAFVLDVEYGQATMKEDVTTLDGAIMPSIIGDGLLGLWTTTFIIDAATADSLYDYYLSLEDYYAYLYSYLMKAASTYVEVEHYLYSNDVDYVAGTLAPKINSEVDEFEQCTYQMLLSKADFVNNFADNPTFVPTVAATNILFRNMFMAAQARGTNAYGLNAMILATMDAVTNGMPPIVAFYNWIPSPEAGKQWPAATWQPQPPVQYFYPVTSRWISVTGPNYDCWGNGRMHATNEYAFLQYGFGTSLPFGSYYWEFSPARPWNPEHDYGGDIKTGHYDDSLNACSTGHVYGFFLTQLRNGGPAIFAGNGMAPFSTTSSTHQVLTTSSSAQGAIMNTSVQYPAGTNIVAVSVLITNGPLDTKNFNCYQSDITVNVHALWSFTYDGQTPASGAIQYKAATSGSYMLYPSYPGHDQSVWQTDSVVAQIDVFDKTTNGVSASGVVKSLSINNKMYTDQTILGLGTNTQGSVAVQFQPGHEYQVRAGWICSLHDAQSENTPSGWRTEAFWYPYALDVTLCVQGLAITFE